MAITVLFLLPTCAVIALPLTFLSIFTHIFIVFVVGIDILVRLHARMVVMLPKFNRTATVCRKKFTQVFVAYKEDKLANGISGNNRQEKKFYEVMDKWYHQAGQVFKHVSATTNDSDDLITASPPQVDSVPSSTPRSTTPSSSSKGKHGFQERSLEILSRWQKLV